MKNTIKKTNTKFSFIVSCALFLIMVFAAAVPAAADTTVAWSQEIGSVTAADMAEDGSIIYAAVGSQIFVYDSAGVQQNTFSITGNVIQLVCTDDGSKAALYTDTNSVYFINNGAITWSESFTGITDIDISNAGSVLIVEGTIFHKYLYDGSLEYDSSSGTFSLGVIDPNDEFAIVQSGNSNLQKYILTTTNDYWAKTDNSSFDTGFQDYQNLLILNSDPVDALILNNQTLGDQLWDTIYTNIDPSKRYYAISNSTQTLSDTYNYNIALGYGNAWVSKTTNPPWSGREDVTTWTYNNLMWIGGGVGSTYYNDVWYSSDGITWTQATNNAAWSPRAGAMSWVYNNLMWIGGGVGSTYYNDVWYSSDGITWTQATNHAAWLPTANGFTWVYNDKMWACTSSLSTNPQASRRIYYSSDGITWTRASNSDPAWGIRNRASTWVYNDLMWFAGGYRETSSPTTYNDVYYSSDGITWTGATGSAAWSPRYGVSTWTYNDLMWIGGTDLWYSSDGITWTRASSNMGWGGTYSTGWVYNNQLWGADKNGVYVSAEGLFIPCIDGRTYLYYNYVGDSPQNTPTTYTNAVDFSGTYELRTKPTLSIYDLQTTKTLTGNISALSLSDRGDWLGTATTSHIYHDQITSSEFGTDYNAVLGSTGTVYDIATANAASMSIAGQGQITDIYSQTASRVGTYTAGGAVEHVDIAGKNALWACSGGEDGKVYIFSKDESSNWYLEYSSDSEGSITALKMSGRGEYVLAGRSGSLTLYQTNTPELVNTDFWFTLYTYRDSDSYRNAAINVSVYNINNQWQPFTEGLTDSIGKFVVKLTAGNTYKFDIGAGQKILIYQATPSITSQVVSIYTSPISAAVTYEAEWDPEIGGVSFEYTDSSGQTQTVIVKITRTDNWQTVYEETFTGQQSIEQAVPIMDDTVGYKVEISATRSSGVTRNTYFVSASRDIVPIPLDRNVMNILFSCLLIFLAGLFSYISAVRGALVVALCAVLFVYMGWLTIPWYWLTVAVVLAFVAGFTQRRS